MSDEQSESPNRDWSRAVAKEYRLDEHEALAAWLDTNLSLNQARLESVTTRLGLVIATAGVLVSVLASTASKGAWPLTLISVVLLLIAAVVAGIGLSSSWHNGQDPTTTWSTMWESRVTGEVYAWLYRTRSDLFEGQARLIDGRASALRFSSWVLGVATLMTATTTLVSRII